MKTQTSLRLDEALVSSLKIEAKRQRRSLNNLIETLLYKSFNVPNEETLKAIKASEKGDLERITNLDEWLDKL